MGGGRREEKGRDPGIGSRDSLVYGILIAPASSGYAMYVTYLYRICVHRCAR